MPSSQISNTALIAHVTVITIINKRTTAANALYLIDVVLAVNATFVASRVLVPVVYLSVRVVFSVVVLISAPTSIFIRFVWKFR